MRRSIEFTGGISFGIDNVIDADALESTVEKALDDIGSPSYEFATDVVG